MVERKKLGWTFSTDGYEGHPYLQCPYCKRKVSGKKAVLADIELDKCPDCGKELSFDNIKEENWLYIESFYGDDDL